MLHVSKKIQAIFFNSLKFIFKFEPITKLNITVSQRNNFVTEKSILTDQNKLRSPSKKIAKDEAETGLKFKNFIELARFI